MDDPYSVSHYWLVELRFAQAARRHRIGRAHVVHVVDHYTPTPTSTPRGDAALEWYGEDSTGRELHVVVVVVEHGDDPLDPDLGWSCT
jgi:hypothetical protein